MTESYMVYLPHYLLAVSNLSESTPASCERDSFYFMITQVAKVLHHKQLKRHDWPLNDQRM